MDVDDDLEQADSTPLLLLPESMEETEEPEEEQESADGDVQEAEIIILEGQVGVGKAAKEGSVGVVVVAEEDPRRRAPLMVLALRLRGATGG